MPVPLVDEKQLATVLQYLDIGKREAKLQRGEETDLIELPANSSKRTST